MLLPDSFGSLRASARPKLNPRSMHQPLPRPQSDGGFPALALPSTIHLQSLEMAYELVALGFRFE